MDHLIKYTLYRNLARTFRMTHKRSLWDCTTCLRLYEVKIVSLRSSESISSANSSGMHQSSVCRWCEKNRDFLERRRSPLEFYLHRSQYMRLLLTGGRTSMVAAREYARDVLCPIYHKYPAEIHRLTACVAFLPKAKLARSPYADLASPTLHQELEPMFAKEYCASLGMSRQVPLRVVCDIGGGGALARIEKGKKVMKERKSEWSQMDELPVCLLAFCRYRLIVHRPD